MKLLSGLVFLSLVLGQVEVIPEGDVAMSQALLMERAGNINGARQIYEKTLESNPKHQRAYQQLKSIFIRSGENEKIIVLLQNWLLSHPQDLHAQLELGEVYFNNQNLPEAKIAWNHYENIHLSNPTTFRLLFHTYTRFGLSKEMEEVASLGREKFSQPAFLALELANYYQARQTYDRAMQEYLRVVMNQPRRLSYVLDRILIMSDGDSAPPIIESALLGKLEDNPQIIRAILAGFYFKSGKFSQALEQHKELGTDALEDKKRWLEFARNLREENQYLPAMEAYHHLLQTLNQNDLQSSQIIGEALLGLGQTYEGQIIEKRNRLQFVSFFPNNIFFEDHFYGRPKISTESLIATLEHYQSILALLPKSSSAAMVQFRLGEIQYRITRDFTGARISYAAAQKSHPNQGLEKLILLRLGDLYMAEGAFDLAEKYFLGPFPPFITREPMNEFTLGRLQAVLLIGDLPKTSQILDSLVLTLSTNHRFFNDLMELQDLIVNHHTDGTRNDKDGFEAYIRAEQFIRQYKLSEGMDHLTFMRKNYPHASITPLATLREAILRLNSGEINIAFDIALALTNTELKDMGLTLAGEIAEHFLVDIEMALNYYNRLLRECSSSILAEPVRLHIRKLRGQQES